MQSTECQSQEPQKGPEPGTVSELPQKTQHGKEFFYPPVRGPPK